MRSEYMNDPYKVHGLKKKCRQCAVKDVGGAVRTV